MMSPEEMWRGLWIVGAEAEMAEHAADALERYVELDARCRVAGGLWGDDAAAHADLLETAAAFRAFPPAAWWRDEP